MVAGNRTLNGPKSGGPGRCKHPQTKIPCWIPPGSFAHVNNTNSVFFIGGTFGGLTTADRSITDVPAGKPLLIPVLNQFDPLDPPNVENKVLSDFQKSVASLFADIDGVPVKNLQSDLVRTDFFSMGPTQPGSLVEQLGAPVGTDLSPTKSSGYWLMGGGDSLLVNIPSTSAVA